MRHAIQQGITRSPGGLQLPQWLGDDYLECYIGWREECAAVRRAYDFWGTVERPDRSAAFAALWAALDREEQAAGRLREQVIRIRRWLID